tara:strand:+ start:4925 stop:5482 length:558 start_codon:yes stop_codon:yes gene_type:complete
VALCDSWHYELQAESTYSLTIFWLIPWVSAQILVKAASRIRDILLDLRELASRAQDGNLTTAERRRISSRFGELIGQVDKIVESAGVQGRNLIAPGSSNVTVQSAEEGRTLQIEAQDLSISGLGFDESRFVAQARVAAVVLRDELGSFRPPIANVDGQSIVGLFSDRGPVQATGNTPPPLDSGED